MDQSENETKIDDDNDIEKNSIVDSTDDDTLQNIPRIENKCLRIENNFNNNIEKFIESSLAIDEYPKKIGYRTVKDMIDRTFFNDQNYFSSIFDIISSYIKAQKTLYLEARSYSVFYLNLLMLPAIFLSGLASVLSLSIENTKNGGIILASVNAFNSFLLAIINYLKLDAAAEAHKTSAHQYDKLQSLCEFTSGKILLLPQSEDFPNYKIAQEKLEIVEKKIKEIKETNQFIIPGEVIKRFPYTYHTNIFSVVKEINKKEIITINRIKDLLNILRPLEYKIRKMKIVDKNLLNEINNIRSQITNETEQLIMKSNENQEIEAKFKNEIIKVSKMYRCWRIFC